MLTIHDLCARFNISRRTVYRYLQEGIIPPPYGKGPHCHYGLAHIEDIEAYFAIKHNNVAASDAVKFCKDAGISMRQYVAIREQSIRDHGLGVG